MLTKLTFCLRRKPGLSWDEFSQYWRTGHAPLVRDEWLSGVQVMVARSRGGSTR